MEENNTGSRDSMKIISNSKGINFEVKVYFKGSGDESDTEEKMKDRLDRYVSNIKDKYATETFI